MPPVSDSSASAPSQSDAAPLATTLPSAESVRALARLLHDSALSEIAWESTSGEHVQRVVLKRTLLAAPSALLLPSGDSPFALSEELTKGPLASFTMGQDGVETVTPQTEAPSVPPVTVASPVVGIFQVAEPPLEVGATVKAQQVIGYVESMRVPNEVRAPSAGVLSALICLPGQGVEYGQPLFEIQVKPQEVAS